MIVHRLTVALVFGVLQAAALPAWAAPEVPPNQEAAPPPAVLGGDWFGLRPELEKRGVTATIGFVGEGAWSVDGGRQHGEAAAYELNLGLNFDLAKIASWNGAKAHVLLIHRDGRNLSAKIGNIFAVQETYSRPEGVGLVTLALEQSFYEGRINVMAGRIPETGDFANSPQYFCRFQNLSICGVPFIFPYDNTVTYYPASSWGARIRGLIGENWQLQTGVYQINPRLANYNGFNLWERGTTGVSVPVELSFRTAGADVYKLGVMYETSRLPELGDSGSSAGPNAIPRKHKGRASAYFAVEQALVGSNKPGARSVVLLAGADVIDRKTSFFQDFEYLSLVVNGPFGGRPNDAAAVLLTRGGVSRDLVHAQRRARSAGASTVPQDYEGVIEIDYRIGVVPGLAITPNVQHIFHPGGSGVLRDATAIGLKIQFAL